MNDLGLTVFDLKNLKGKRTVKFVQVDTLDQAIAAKEAGIEIIGTGYSESKSHFPRSLKGVHFQFGLQWGEHANADEALRSAMQVMNHGAQSIYCPMSPQVIEVLAREGVPVIAHAGLIPPKITLTGGYRAVGKSLKEAKDVWNIAKSYESAGAFAIELEVIPDRLAKEITNRTSLFTISLGSGADCDAQYLFSADILGENKDFFPRHAKKYIDLSSEYKRLHNERVSAYKEYISDVEDKVFGKKDYSVSIDDNVIEELISSIK
ncbi:3-methyl-2-oxobutanoate hydroxymethyltransferase [Candidatus Thioglobus sp.]|nr:3-methyl-2-oxobutanoate hydroxymethyltransferase [Candidatus Thioglobus sp.]